MASERLRPPGRPPKPDQPRIGQSLKELRLSFGWSQERLAELTGLRRTEISLIEQGRNKGTSWRVRMWLAKGFGVPAEVLNAYWEGRLTLQEIATKIKATGIVPQSRPSESVAGDPLARYPKLREALGVVAKHAKAKEEVVRNAAVVVAASYGTGTDHDVSYWTKLIEAQLGRARGTRMIPRSIPNLTKAIELVAEHQHVDRSVVEDKVPYLLAVHENPTNLSVVQWILAIEQGPEAGTETKKRGPKPDRPAKKRAKPRR